jgi:hypothetical protein
LPWSIKSRSATKSRLCDDAPGAQVKRSLSERARSGSLSRNLGQRCRRVLMLYGTNREIDPAREEKPRPVLGPDQLQQQCTLMPFRDPERRRAYRRAYTAARRRARGVPELSSPDSITANKPWEAIGVCRRWWFERFRWQEPTRSQWKHRERANG